MWMLPLYLHANQKSAAAADDDDDEDDVCVKVLKNQNKALIGVDVTKYAILIITD